MGHGNGGRAKMRRARRRQLVMALGLVMLLGIAFHFRLWTIDYDNSFNDAELLRNQFDLANREAMDESAEWRRRYDSEFEKAAKCYRELDELKNSGGGETATVSTTQNKKMEMLQKENMYLLEKVESLKQEVEMQHSKSVNCQETFVEEASGTSDSIHLATAT